ncbi:MAG: hypothetical protein ACMV1K_06035 [Sulfurospirillum sp.]|jgi:hypothetical protein
MSAALIGQIVFGLFVAMICFLAFLKVQATKEHKDTNLDKENQ